MLDFVSTGGYALKTYDRFRRIVKGRDGLWRVRNAADRPAPPDERRRHRRRRRCSTCGWLAGAAGGGRKIGEVEEWYLEGLTAGDTFLFAGQVWRFEGIAGVDVLVTRSPRDGPEDPQLGRLEIPAVHLPGQAGARA